MKTTNAPAKTLTPGAPQAFLLPAATPLTEEAVNLLHDMLTNLSAFAVRNTLLELYHTYVRYEHANLPNNFDEMSTHFFCLDNILRLLTEKEFGGDGVDGHGWWCVKIGACHPRVRLTPGSDVVGPAPLEGDYWWSLFCQGK